MRWLRVWLGMCLALGMAGAKGKAVAAEGAVEGIVRLPPPAVVAAGPSQARYRGVAPKVLGRVTPLVGVVYLEGAGAAAAAATNGMPVRQVVQKELQFLPFVLPVLKSTRVEFPNQDPEYHNVLSYSKPKEFDLGRYLPGEKPPSIIFDRAGVVELNCEIHDQMRGYIVVLETPYFAVTDAEGRFRISGVTAGEYQLKVWVNPRVTWTRPITLADGLILRVDLPVEP